MNALLKIFCLVFICAIVVSSKPQENFSFLAPEYISADKSFEISIITSKEYPEADKLLLILIPRDGLILNEVSINSENKLTKLTFSSAAVSEFGISGFITVIDLTDPNIVSSDFFQILVTCRGSGESAELVLKGIFKENDKEIGNLRTNDQSLNQIDNDFYSASFSFYKQSKIADQSIKFLNNSSLSVPLNYSYSNNIFVEFWLKIDKSPINFLQIKNSKSGSIEYEISANSFQILNAESGMNDSEQIFPHFISKNTWYHLSVLFNTEYQKADFYCDGKLIGSLELPNYLNPNDFLLEFKNTSANQSFNLDQLRICDLAGTINYAVKNINFKSVQKDSARVLLQLNFNEYELYQLSNSGLIKYNNLKFTKSDAPLFPRAPVINLNVFNSYYEIQWKGGDYSSAVKYILEKSDNGDDFKEIYNVDAELEKDKVYSFVSERINGSDLIYYRVRQINNDGSSVYSAQAKVGQGMFEDVILAQNYPNPFNPLTQIEFELLQDGEVEVIVYDLEGQQLTVLQNGFLSKGTYNYKFDGSELPSGIYLYKVSTSQFTQTKKMILAK